MPEIVVEVGNDPIVVEVGNAATAVEVGGVQDRVIEVGTQGPSGAIALADHLAAPDPHPQYATEADVNQIVDRVLPFYRSFVNEDLTNSKLILNHDRNQPVSTVTLINDLGEEICPANTRKINSNALEIDLEGLTPIANIWSAKIS